MKHKLLIVSIILTLASCTEFLEQEPTTILTDDSAITNEASAQEAVLGMYSSLRRNGHYGIYHVLVPDVLSDVLQSNSALPNINEFDNNEVLTENVFLQNMWTDPYYSILTANHILEKIPPITSIPIAAKSRMVAEAKFIRALSHFNLTRLFGDIPIITTTDKTEIENTQRQPVSEVLNQIIQDLVDAETDLFDNQEAIGNFTSNEASRVLATKAAASALLSRVYLFRASSGDFDLIINKTTSVIENSFYELEEVYDEAFSGRSKETIFEVYYAQDEQARLNLESTPGNQFNYAVTNDFIAAFEDGDLRKDFLLVPSMSSFYSMKYGALTSPAVVLRLADMYLMRAEARVRSDNLEGGLEDLNIIRERAGLTLLENLSKEELLLAIEKERFIEFAYEGLRFVDLKRTGRTDAVLGSHNPNFWQSTDQLLPIPFLEVNNGLTQNPGY